MIYVHIPFCRSFCTYCDFYSEVAAKCRRAEDLSRQDELFARFSESLGREISLRADEITDDYNTLYIGGGTPSVLPLSVYASLMDALASVGIHPPFEEFTFEVNPEDLIGKGEAYVEGLMKLGVNRFSMGVQSFDDGILKWMNRRHDSAAARQAYSILENAGAENISIDLIFGMPQLSDSIWGETLEKALSISRKGNPPKHISSYQLSVEPGSALSRMVERGLWTEASDEQCAHQYDMLCDTLAKSGYHHYEISNFALPGFEARHNSAYWTHVPYVGLGPGAHSFSITQSPGATALKGIGALSAFPYLQGQIPGPVAASDDALSITQSLGATTLKGRSAVAAAGKFIRQWNNPDLQAYMADPQSVQEHEDLDGEQLVLEKIMLALRTSAGIPEAFLKAHADHAALEYAMKSGDLVYSHVSGNLRIPENRFFVSDNIIAYICGC